MTWISASFNGLSATGKRRISAGTSTRQGGVSLNEYQGLNLGTHVGDDLECVLKNREILKSFLSTDSALELQWLNQTHTTNVVWLSSSQSANKAANLSEPQTLSEIQVLNTEPSYQTVPGEVDGAITNSFQIATTVLTADCLPIVITDANATFVACLHAGWRGLANGIINNGVSLIQEKIKVSPNQLTAWIGPAISQAHFEVGQEVKATFQARLGDVDRLFHETSNSAKTESNLGSECSSKKFMADLPGLAELNLSQLGVTKVTKSGLCTYANSELFYSYRRDGQTGRMATIAWLNEG